VTAFVYQQIYAKKGADGTTLTTPYGTAQLTAAVADNLWLEQARKIAYDDSIAYEIETMKGASSFIPGHLNSAFSPEDLCSNYLGCLAVNTGLAAAAGRLRQHLRRRTGRNQRREASTSTVVANVQLPPPT
jgi:hypothetical protein